MTSISQLTGTQFTLFPRLCPTSRALGCWYRLFGQVIGLHDGGHYGRTYKVDVVHFCTARVIRRAANLLCREHGIGGTGRTAGTAGIFVLHRPAGADLRWIAGNIALWTGFCDW